MWRARAAAPLEGQGRRSRDITVITPFSLQWRFNAQGKFTEAIFGKSLDMPSRQARGDRARAVATALLCASSAVNHVAGATSREHTCAKQDAGQEAVFECGGRLISQVEFASFGTPGGTCIAASGMISGATTVPGCDAANTVATIEDRCLGQSTCMFTVTPDLFGGTPSCAHADSSRRWLMAQLKCGGDESPDAAAPAPRDPALGWQFIAFVFMVGGIYLGLGIVYKVRREGAKLNSLEAIPHVEMWKELPALVRDGVVFSIDTIKSKGRPSYDSVGSL